MYKYLILFVLFIGNIAHADNINNIFESVVKVNNNGQDYGTGNCINIDEKYVYIITNRHVVGNSSSVSVQFYREGHQSVGIPGQVIWTAYRSNEPIDIAIISVEKSRLDNWTPTIINFNPDGKVYNVGKTVLTIGCPQAKWPRAYRGHIESIENGRYFITPTVEPGQSGSVLFNEDGTEAIGLIAWTDGTNGIAMTGEVIKRAVFGQASGYRYKQPYNFLDTELIPVQCPDGNCPILPNGPLFRQQPRSPQYPQYPQNPQYPPSPQNPQQPRNPDGGLKIFPTYPGDPNSPNDEFIPRVPDGNPVPPVPPVPKEPIPPAPPKEDPRMAEFEKRIIKLEDDNKTGNTKLDSITINIEKLTGKVDDLAKKVDGTPKKDEVVTPGKLEDTINTKLDLQTNWVKSTLDASQKDITDKLTDKIEKQLQPVVSNTDKLVEKTKEVIHQIEYVQTDKQADRNYGIYETATGVGIPSLAFILVGRWLISRLGGTALLPFLEKQFPQSPSPQSQQSQQYQQPQNQSPFPTYRRVA